MANLLGQILVSLGFDGAGFFSGMDKAEVVAKKTGKEIEGAMSQMGSAAEIALAPFGEFGAVVGAALDKVGGSAANALESITKFAGGGGLGLVAGVAAGASAALVAADAAFVGIAVHAAENANKIFEMSQKTGVAVETLSGFAAVGKVFGVSSEQMGSALNKLNKSAFAAATAADDSKSAYARLGIEVKDADGKLRPTSDLLLDVAEKFSNMPDGVAKSALAMQIFGKSGAEMIPFLNEGKDGIQEYTDAAQKMGVVLSTDAASAAHQFSKDISMMELGVQGIENKIMTALVPALTVVADQFVSAMEEPDSTLNTLLNIVTNLTKAIITVGETVYAVFTQIGTIIGTELAIWETAGETMANVSEKLLHLDFAGAKQAAKDGMAAVVAQVQYGAEESARVWKDYSATVGKVWNPPPPPKPKERTQAADDGSAETLRQQETAEKQLLDITQDRYKQQLAAAHLYYEQGTIDTAQLVEAETTAANLGYQAHVNYFAKLRSLYANDPIKLQAIAADETKFKLEDLAKTTESLAAATKKYNEEAQKSVAESQKALSKEQSEDLKRLSKATLDYAHSLHAVSDAQAAMDTAKQGGDYASQVEEIKQAMEEGLRTRRDGWKAIESLDKQEFATELGDLKAHDEQLAAELKAAQEELAAAQAQGDRTMVLEAQARLNQIKAATIKNQTDILNLQKQFNKKLAEDEVKARADITAVMQRFNQQFMSAFNGMITGTESVGKAFKKLFQGILTDLADFVVQWLLKKVEMWAMDKVLSQTARSTEGPAQVASAAAVGTANAIASFAAAPWPVDMGAPAFGATIGATIAALAPAAAAEKGADLSGYSLGQPIPMIAHGQEMILPADLSSGIKNMIRGNRTPPGGFGTPNVAASSTNIGGHTFHIDARGADAGVEERIRKGVRDAINHSVAHSISAVNDRARRHA